MGNGEWGTGLGYGVEFNLDGEMWDSWSHTQIVRVMKGRW